MSRRWRHALVIVAGWTLVAALFTPQIYLLNQRAPNPLSWFEAFAANATTFYVWALLTPLVMWLGRRSPMERDHIWSSLLVHVGAAFVFAALHLLLVQTVHSLLSGEPWPPRPWSAMLVGYGATNILVFGAVAACVQALAFYTRYQEREFRLAQAQLQMLRAQLHPHFLFNTINAIAELIHLDPGRAERTLTQLSDLLRQAVADDQVHSVPLDSERDWLCQYLAIYETLLQERLTVQWDIAPEAQTALVPAMVMQPLVENAIRHGLAPRATGGTLVIRARRTDARLLLVVEDDGVGLGGAASAASSGVGLMNVRARLRSLYGDAASLSVEPRVSGGVITTVTVPWKEAE